MNILLVSHFFWPEIGAPQTRLLEICRHWQSQGHQVTVYTGFPNHPKGRVPAPYRGRRLMKESKDGLEIIRHWVYCTPKSSVALRSLGHVSLVFSIALQSLFRGPRPDVVVVSSPSFFSLYAGWLISRMRGAPLVVEIRDLWPGIFVQLGVLRNRVLLSFLEWWELFFYRSAAKVVTVTHGFKDDIAGRGIDPRKIEVITNGINQERCPRLPPRPGLREDLGLGPKEFVALYLGNHGISQGLHAVVRAAELLGPEAGVRFLFVGDGPEKERLRGQAADLPQVQFLPPVPQQEVGSFYSLADCCLVPLRKIDLFTTFIPSKLFEALATGLPVVGMLEGEAAEILDQASGIVVGPEDAPALASALQRLREHPEEAKSRGRAGRRFVLANYGTDRLAGKYLALFKQIARVRT